MLGSMTNRATRATVIAAAAGIACCAVPNAATIRSALDEGDADRALELAVADDRSLDLLAREILKHGVLDEETREDAFAAIRRTGRRADPLLEELAAIGDPLVAAPARSLLFRRGDRSYGDELVEALDSNYGLVRAAAVEAMLTMEQGRSFHEHTILDREPTARLAVVRHLASHDLPWSQDLLLDAARKDPNERVRAAAIAGLDPTEHAARDVLRETLSHSSKRIRLAAAQALGSDPASAELTWAEHLLTLPPTEEGLRFATSLLGTGEAPAAAEDYLAGTLADESPSMRLAAVNTLIAAGLEVEGVDDLADDPNPQVRVAWCRLSRKLSTSRREERLSILEAVIDDPDGDPPLGAWATLAEEKNGYALVRPRVWHLLETGTPRQQRYVLVHANRPFRDSSLAIHGMGLEPVTVRLAAAAAWLGR
jgi:HEAT repeat protein